MSTGAYLQLLVITAVIAILPGRIAAAKGRSFALWWFYGFMLFLPALVHSLLIRPRPQTPQPTAMWMPPPPYGSAPPPPPSGATPPPPPPPYGAPWPRPWPDAVDTTAVDQGPAMAPCPSCGELVRADTPACPFCRAAVAK